MKFKYPYQEYENSKLWLTIQNATTKLMSWTAEPPASA